MSPIYQIYIESKTTNDAKIYRGFVCNQSKIFSVAGYVNTDPNQKIHKGKVAQIFPNGKAKINITNDFEVYTERSFKGLTMSLGDTVWVQSTNNSPVEMAYKNPKGTLNIALPLGPVILYPFDSGIHISQRLKNYPEFANTLKQHFEGMAGTFGIKFRLASKDYSLKLLEKIISFGKAVWDQDEYNRTELLIFNELLSYFLSPVEVFTNDPEVEKWIQKSFHNIFEIPIQIKKLPQDLEALEDAWDRACRRDILLSSGGNILLQETAGCLVVDVNAGANSSFETVNKEVIKILPNILLEGRFGGKIVVDLLPIPSYSVREQLLSDFYEACEFSDMAVQLYGISKMGLLEFILPRRGYPLWWIDKNFL